MASVTFPARPAAFGKRGVLALVLVGTLAFLALLYFIGTDRMGGSENNGQAHAASKGLTGYAALVRLLEAEGHEVSTSRSEAVLDEPVLLVLTPSQWTSPEDMAKLIERRADYGPTLVILPKWFTEKAEGDKAKPGWVTLGGANKPFWDLEIGGDGVAIGMTTSKKPVRRVWDNADGLAGELPPSTAIQFFDAKAESRTAPLVTSRQRVLAGLFHREEKPTPAATNGDLIVEVEPDPTGFEDDVYTNRFAMAAREAWRVTVVAEPDLMNNWGMADEARAKAALEIIDVASGYQSLPIVFDLTTNGLGLSRNLLTLAFEPPFLAATLCLLVALLLVGWRAFRRFGPPLAEDLAFAFGKAQLVENGGGVIQRTGRMHLLTRPYAAMVESRIARKLGLRGVPRETLDKMLARRGLEAVSPRLSALENARHSKDIIRAARALHSLERTITR